VVFYDTDHSTDATLATLEAPRPRRVCASPVGPATGPGGGTGWI
jgi:hypothetical protein